MVSNDEIGHEKDRERGILSNPDRKWLVMPRDEYAEEHSRQYWGQRRDEVVKRVRNALFDFSLLLDHLDEETRNEIFYRNATGSPVGDRDERLEQYRALQDAFAFLMLSVPTGIRTDVRDDVSSTFERPGELWELLEGAFKDAALREDVLIDQIDPPKFYGRVAPNIETILQRAQEGKELSGSELELLLQSGRVNKERFFEAVSKAVDSDTYEE